MLHALVIMSCSVCGEAVGFCLYIDSISIRKRNFLPSPPNLLFCPTLFPPPLCWPWAGRMSESVSGHLKQCQGQQNAQTNAYFHIQRLTQDVRVEHWNSSFLKKAQKYCLSDMESCWISPPSQLLQQPLSSAFQTSSMALINGQNCLYLPVALLACDKLTFDSLGVTASTFLVC